MSCSLHAVAKTEAYWMAGCHLLNPILVVHLNTQTNRERAHRSTEDAIQSHSWYCVVMVMVNGGI